MGAVELLFVKNGNQIMLHFVSGLCKTAIIPAPAEVSVQ